MHFLNGIIYVISFLMLWFGAGLIVGAASKFSKRLTLSPFTFSFVFLALLTSIPEFSVGIQAVVDHNGEIFVGNLLGGIIVLFLLVIPLLAIVGNGISLKHEMDQKLLLPTLGVILAPSLFILDKRVTNLEGVIMLVLYGMLLFLIERKHGIFDKYTKHLLAMKAYSYIDMLKILAGIGIVFVASNLIVEKTTYFADLFHISSFYIGLLIIALGTDLPELTLAIRSVVSGKKELAMGDYIGAAAVSTFLFGLFTLLHHGEVLTISNFMVTYIFISLALVMFWYFFSSKQYISRLNGIVLVGIYVLFVIVEILTKS